MAPSPRLPTSRRRRDLAEAFLGARLPTPTATEADVGFIWVNPDESNDDNNNIYAPNNTLLNANRFAFASATHLGRFLANARGFDTSTAVGFHTTVDFDNDDEARCLPVECNPTPGGCTDRVTEALGRAAERKDGEGIAVRELVPDFDFRISTGIVENAQTIYGGLPLNDQLPGSALTALRTFIEKTARDSWVPDGTWRIDAGAVMTSDEALPVSDDVAPDCLSVDTLSCFTTET